ncbi:MAG: CapA family protein [Oscillospiraceae bacterium]|nr:CapA family protein [Oscillospiraceae bacterium]
MALISVSAALVRNPNVIRRFKNEVVISIAGDVLLDRGVAVAIAQYGAAYPYEGVSGIFNADDITIANLECPLTQAGGGAMKPKRFVFKADPDNAGELKSAGFDVLTLANNHTMDYLSDGLSDTISALDNAGLHHSGAGLNGENIPPLIIEKHGVSIGILSYSALPPEGFMYDGDSATIAYARAEFLDDMKAEIADAAARCDFLLVYFHWGAEYRHDIDKQQLEIAHAAVDSGAGSVIGSHPHVLQGKEIYNGAPIYYSLGNFVFDSQIPEGTDEAVIVQLTIGKGGIVSTRELPVIIKDAQPRVAEGERSEQIHANMEWYSQRFK